MSINLDDSIVALDAQAVRESVRLVEAGLVEVGPVEAGLVEAGLVEAGLAEAMTWPTPCAGWTLHDLLAHMTTQHYGFAAASTADGDLSLWHTRPLGDDPVAAYRTSADHVLAAFAADGVLDQQFALPEITRATSFPARKAISFHFIDYVVHSWDVAKTLSLEANFDQALLDVALAVAKAVPGGKARLAPGAAFAPSLDWPGDSRLDQIVAILGRSPDWQPPA
jgi:uncharacterized protein (TIGR03086 family)